MSMLLLSLLEGNGSERGHSKQLEVARPFQRQFSGSSEN